MVNITFESQLKTALRIENIVFKNHFFYSYCFHSGGSAVICIMGLKLLRGSFSDSSRQHLVLLWTVLFFHFDYRHSSETFVVDYFFMSIFMSKVSSSRVESFLSGIVRRLKHARTRAKNDSPRVLACSARPN